jgi:hypothetical protein
MASSGCNDVRLYRLYCRLSSSVYGYCHRRLLHHRNLLWSQPLLHAVVSEVLPRKQRPFAQATVTGSAGIGAFIGVCMGGTLLRHGDLQNYRIYLYVTAGVFFLAALGLALFYNPPSRELQASLSTGQKVRALNWVSYVLFTPGLVLFCIGLSWSRNPYPWTDPRVLATFLIGVALIAAFFVYEWRFKSDGILNHEFFHNRNFALALLTIFAEGVAFFSFNAYFSFEIGVRTGSDLFMAALPLGVTFLASLVFAYAVGLYSSKSKQLRAPITIGFTFILSFFVTMAVTYSKNIQPAYWGLAVILGAGSGIILPLVMVVAQLSTPADLISMASALVIATRSLGGTVGLAINNALFNSALATEIPSRIAAATLPLGLPATSLPLLIGALTSHNISLLEKVPGATPEIIGAAGAALTDAYGVAFRNCWIAASCFIALAVIGKGAFVYLCAERSSS